MRVETNLNLALFFFKFGVGLFGPIIMSADHLFGVTVDDPKTEGMVSKHTTYRIVCSLRAGGGESSTRHRFSEFLELRDALMRVTPGVVIPPLPEKKMMNRARSHPTPQQPGPSSLELAPL